MVKFVFCNTACNRLNVSVCSTSTPALLFTFQPLMSFSAIVVSNFQCFTYSNVIYGCNSAPTRVLHLTPLPLWGLSPPVWKYQTSFPGLLNVIAKTEWILLLKYRQKRSADKRRSFILSVISQCVCVREWGGDLIRTNRSYKVIVGDRRQS